MKVWMERPFQPLCQATSTLGITSGVSLSAQKRQGYGWRRLSAISKGGGGCIVKGHFAPEELDWV